MRLSRSSGSRTAAAALGFALLATGCSSTGTPATGTEAAAAANQAPATITTMICKPEAIAEIASALGVKATVSSPTWINDVYSCTYKYPSGSMQLSVNQLSNTTQTDAYYHQLAARMGDTGTIPGLGQGAFHTTDGSVVVRKDTKVLLVDVTGLPAQLGQPPTTPGNVALTVATVILACWSGD